METWEHVSVHCHQGKYQLWANCFMCWMPALNAGPRASGNSATHCCMETILQWRHNGHDSISNHQPHDCLLNPLFRRRSKKTSKLRVTGFVRGIHRGPVNSPHKWPVTRKMFPIDDVIMIQSNGHFKPLTQMWATISVIISCYMVPRCIETA